MDAIDMISSRGAVEEQNIITRITEGKVLVRMLAGAGWTTPSGVHFTKTSPFKLCDWHEAEVLIKNNPDRFVEGQPEDLKAFYDGE